jgi:hypothetical protein
VVFAVLRQKQTRNFPAPAGAKRGQIQTPANMLCGDAHVAHYKFRLTKYQCVDALQDKVFFTYAINFFFQGYQKGAVDIAIPEFPDINDPALGAELLCSNRNIVQGFPLVLSFVKSDRYSIENIYQGQIISHNPPLNHRGHRETF